MKRLGILAAIWIVLFGATIVVNLVSGDGRAKAAVVRSDATNTVDEILEQRAQMQLAGEPRKTEFIPQTPNFDEVQYEQLATELRTVILENWSQVRPCLAASSAAITRPTEYFEISFIFRNTDSAAFLRLDDLVLERSTVPIREEDEKCMFDILRELRFAASSAPAERTYYQVCLHRPSQPTGSVKMTRADESH